MDRRFDPRSIVTPYAFAVHPDLLGMPLATPWQRLGAILVDLVVIGFISQIGFAPLALASTGLLLWLAFRKPGRDLFGKLFRIAVGCLGFFALVITVLVILAIRFGPQLEEFLREQEGISETLRVPLSVESGVEGGGQLQGQAELGLGDLVSGFQDVVNLQNAETREEAQTLLNEFARRAYQSGISMGNIRDIAGSLLPEDVPWASETEVMVNEAIEAIGAQDESRAEGLPSQEAGAEAFDSLAPAEGETVLGPEAQDSIATLTEALRRALEEQSDLSRALQETESALQEERNEGLFAWLWNLVDDLGLGFGWGALYLTITHTWWRGTSIGKKLFRIRVVMIDKRPLNWWLSFERAGGYAAGFATGLLGFAQIFWDPNRQAIHDKVSETIVIQEGKKPVPGPWIEEGEAQWERGRHGTLGNDGM